MNQFAQRLKDLGLETHDVNDLSGLEQVGPGKALLKAATNKLEKQRVLCETKARIVNEGDISKDFRHMIGFIAGVKWMMSLSREARNAKGEME